MKYKVQDFFILSEKYAAIDTRLWDTDCRLENMSTCWEGEKIKRPGKLHTPLSPRPCQSFSFVWLALSYVLCNNLAIWIQTSTGKTYFFLEEITEVLQVLSYWKPNTLSINSQGVRCTNRKLSCLQCSKTEVGNFKENMNYLVNTTFSLKYKNDRINHWTGKLFKTKQSKIYWLSINSTSNKLGWNDLQILPLRS